MAVFPTFQNLTPCLVRPERRDMNDGSVDLMNHFPRIGSDYVEALTRVNKYTFSAICKTYKVSNFDPVGYITASLYAHNKKYKYIFRNFRILIYTRKDIMDLLEGGLSIC